jgi:hypothetical protein
VDVAGSVGEVETEGVEVGVEVGDAVGVDVGGSAKRDGVRLGVNDGDEEGVAEASIRGCTRAVPPVEKASPAHTNRAAGRVRPWIWAIGSPLWAPGSCDVRTISACEGKCQEESARVSRR